MSWQRALDDERKLGRVLAARATRARRAERDAKRSQEVIAAGVARWHDNHARRGANVRHDLASARAAREALTPTTPNENGDGSHRPAGASQVTHEPAGRWFHVDESAPEARAWESWLHSLFRDAPRLRSLVIKRSRLTSERGADCTLTAADGGGLHATIVLNDDLGPTSVYSHESERLLKHELAHLCHAIALGEAWHTLTHTTNEPEVFAVRMERELQPGIPAAAYIAMVKGGDDDDA